MKLLIRIFIQKHKERTYTVTVPALPNISAYGPTLEECKEEVAEALAQTLAEVDQEFLYTFAQRPDQRLEQVSVLLYPTDHRGKRRREPFKFIANLMLTPEEDGQILVTAPRLTRPPLSFYISKPQELADIAQLELAQYFYEDSLERIMFFQAARRESLDTIEVDFKAKKAKEQTEEEEEENFWALKASGSNLTAQAGEGQLRRTYRRDKEVEDILASITSDRRPGIILNGPSGAGKTAIVHEVARRIRRKECPEALHDRQVWSVTAENLLAGCSYIGQWEEKLLNVVQEVRKKRHILFVNDIASLCESGRWSKSDQNMAKFLTPYIQTGDVVLIGEATPERLHRAEQLTPSFVAQFRTLEIAPTSEADTLSILAAVGRELERSEEVRIEPSALEAALELTRRFLPYRAQPGSSIALLEQVAGDAQRTQNTPSFSTTQRAALTRKHTIATFTRQTGLPEFIVSDAIPLNLDDVLGFFDERIIGQDAAVQAMVDLIAVIKSGLSDPDKPLGSFLFIGPTGVGKTQLAKTLAAYLFSDAKRVIRFDMSEYSDSAGIYRLIGVPGSKNDENDGELTRRIRNQPFCVLLLDEFEKASSQIYDVFLQVLGEGRLTDATGRTTSFQNAIIILTSNLGASAREQRNIGLPKARGASSSSGGTSASLPDLADEEPLAPEQRATDDKPRPASTQDETTRYWQRKVEDYFRPEFVNRLDRIISFKPLNQEAMRRIAARELSDVLLREGLVRRNILVEIDNNVVDILVDQGFHPTYGARPLKRAIERMIVLPLARFLASRAQPGSDLIRLHRQNDEIVLSTANIQEADKSSDITLTGSTASLTSGSRRRMRVDDKGLVEAFAELRRLLQDWEERDAVIEMRNERATCLARSNEPSFWNDGEAARDTLARFYFLDRLLKRLQQLLDRAEYLEELAGLVHRQRDPRYRADLAESYEQLYRNYAFLNIELLCAHIKHNHRAVMLLRPVGTQTKNDPGIPWIIQLATIYTRWMFAKGYDVACYQLESIPDDERTEHRMSVYPYRWRDMNASDMTTLLSDLEELNNVNELAFGITGTNVYGFLKGEIGIHRRNDRRPSGERVQHLVEVGVHAPGELDIPEYVEKLILNRINDQLMRSRMSKKELANLPAEPEPEIIRVYQFDSERMVRDTRTQQKTTDITAILEGKLDDFILAYLQEEEVKQAWDEDV